MLPDRDINLQKRILHHKNEKEKKFITKLKLLIQTDFFKLHVKEVSCAVHFWTLNTKKKVCHTVLEVFGVKMQTDGLSSTGCFM